MLTIGTAFYDLKAALHLLYDEREAAAIAHEVMEHITGLNRLERLTRKEQKLSGPQSESFAQLKTVLLKGVPLQYVFGVAHFLGRPFKVSPAVLIPRPETEELVQWIIDAEHPQKMLDIGTGSGCIAISLKLALPGCEVSAIDVSPEALEVAGQNAKALDARIDFIEADFLIQGAWAQLSVYDVIVSNPPYIPESERQTLHTNVRDHEPAAALFVAGNDALLFYEAIAAFGKTHLASEGTIYCELHRDYAAQTAALFRNSGYTNVTLRRDMHGNPRMLQARL
jgi:release factor glutamine methyltransferase